MPTNHKTTHYPMENMTRAEIETVVKFIKALNVALHRQTGRTVTFLPNELPAEIDVNELNIVEEEDCVEIKNAKNRDH